MSGPDFKRMSKDEVVAWFDASVSSLTDFPTLRLTSFPTQRHRRSKAFAVPMGVAADAVTLRNLAVRSQRDPSTLHRPSLLSFA